MNEQKEKQPAPVERVVFNQAEKMEHGIYMEQGVPHEHEGDQTKLFTRHGIQGSGNQEITVEVAVQLATAYAFLMEKPSRIGISACDHPFSQLLKHGMMTSLCCAGMETVDFGIASEVIQRFGVQRHHCQGSILVEMNQKTKNQVVIRFFDQLGGTVSTAWMNSLEAAYKQKKRLPNTAEQLGRIYVKHDICEEYVQSLLEKAGSIHQGV